MSEHAPPDSMSPEGLDDIFDRIEADIEAERGIAARLRELSRTRAAALFAGVVLGVVGAWLWLGPRADLDVYPQGRLALELSALALLSMSAGWTFVRPLSEAEPNRTWVRVRLAAHLLVAAAIVSAPAAHAHEPFATGGGGAQLWLSALTCLTVGSSVAVPLLLLLWLLDRGGRSGAVTWLAPFAAWLAGMATLQTHCPLLAHEHQWTGHFGLIVPITLLWLLLRRGRVGQ